MKLLHLCTRSCYQLSDTWHAMLSNRSINAKGAKRGGHRAKALLIQMDPAISQRWSSPMEHFSCQVCLRGMLLHHVIRQNSIDIGLCLMRCSCNCSNGLQAGRLERESYLLAACRLQEQPCDSPWRQSMSHGFRQLPWVGSCVARSTVQPVSRHAHCFETFLF